jgi:hypothetical protein
MGDFNVDILKEYNQAKEEKKEKKISWINSN